MHIYIFVSVFKLLKALLLNITNVLCSIVLHRIICKIDFKISIVSSSQSSLSIHHTFAVLTKFLIILLLKEIIRH